MLNFSRKGDRQLCTSLIFFITDIQTNWSTVSRRFMKYDELNENADFFQNTSNKKIGNFMSQ